MTEAIIGLLHDLFKAIDAGKKKKVKQAVKSLQPLLDSFDTNVIAALRKDENPFKDTNLILLCCKYGHLIILDYILSNGKQFIDRLYNGTVANSLSPLDKDGEGHNAFYYAIRSNNVEIVQLLLTKWLTSFDESVARKDILLSEAHEELKLRNVRLTAEMEFFVESEIVASRFNSNFYGHVRNSSNDLFDRIDWLLTNIDSLKMAQVESTFLVLAEFIAQSMNILKHQLKATYETIPWEEIEFCLITYIVTKRRPQERSILPLVAIRNDILLSQLDNFAAILKKISVDDLRGPNELPNFSRKEVTSKIKEKSPEFISLYEIYGKARDLYSLEKIAGYLKLSLSVNHKEKQGQLAIIRVLQILSDYLKNSLNNCKLSDAMSRIILSALPKKIRNSLSLVHSREERVKIEEERPAFFRDTQNDLKLLSYVVSRILNNKEVMAAVELLEKVTKSDNVAEVCELTKNIKYVKNCVDAENFKFEQEKLKRLISELEAVIPIPGLSGRERQLFKDVNSMLAEEREYDLSLSLLADEGSTTLMRCFDKLQSFDRKPDAWDLEVVKTTAAVALRGLSPESYIKSISKHLVEFVKEIVKSLKRKLHCSNFSESDVERMNMLLIEISFAAARKFEDGLCLDVAQEVFDSAEISEQVLSETERKTYLRSRLDILKDLTGDRKENITLRLATEYLLIDILSISDNAECESENVLNVEDCTPYLNGKSLKNYLAHGIELFDIFLTEPATAIQSNASLFINGESSIENWKIKDLLSNDVSQAKEKLRKNIDIVTRQYKLFRALEEGDAETSLAMIKSGADVFGRSINNESCLHFAARGLNIDLAKLIVEQKVEIDSTEEKGRTLIHIAAAHGNMALIEYLINNVANVDLEQKDKNGRTSLHLAAQHGETESVKLLIQLGADLSSLTDEKSRAPHWDNSRAGVVGKLFDHGANIFGCGMIGRLSPLHIAAAYNCAEVIKVLLEKGVDVDIPNDLNSTPLIAAAENGSVEAAEILIRAGANVNAHFKGCFTALHCAADKGHTAMAEVLLQNGADTDPANNLDTPIHFAALNGRVEMIKLLIQHKANPNRRNSWGCPPLHLAAERGHADVIEVLLASGVDVKSRDKRSTTALHYSALKGFQGVTKLLIEKGAQLDAIETFQCTALHFAAEKGHEEVGEILVKKGAKINVTRGRDGFTPLHLAIRENANSLVKLLLENGANTEQKNYIDMTALHIGSIFGNVNGISHLLKFKCDVNARGNHGKTPLHCAAALNSGDSRTIALLLANGADLLAEDAERETPLSLAIKRDNLEKVIAMYQSGKLDKNVCFWNNMTPLHLSAAFSLDIVKFLVDNDFAPNPMDNVKVKPIHVSCASGRQDIVEYFLDSGVNIDERSYEQRTPLHIAATSEHHLLVEYLVSKGANVNARDSDKITPLLRGQNNGFIVKLLLDKGAFFDENMPISAGAAKIYLDTMKLLGAVKRNDVSEVKKLIKQGAYLNAVSSSSGSSLHFASCKGYFDIVKLLLENNANVNVLASKNCTPLHYASKNSHENIVLELLIHGAVYNALTDGGKTPLRLATDENIRGLLSVIEKCFDQVEKGDLTVESTIQNLSSQNGRHLRALTRTRNRNNQDILQVCYFYKYPRPNELFEVCHAEDIKMYFSAWRNTKTM